MTSLRALQYFVAVAEEGQLTRAAQRLHISQPALSQAIAQLETQVGVELLERHSRGVGLTPAGETFFLKARTAVEALTEVDVTADSLARAARQSFECGFVGTPPTLDAPELFAQFTASHPGVEIAYREMPFPCGSMSAALEPVDVALLYAPTADPEVDAVLLRLEPRYVIMASTHALAEREELTVGELLDETFCGTHPACEPVRAGFWRLDDHRGAPARTTSDQAVNPLEVLSVVAGGGALWTAASTTAQKVIAALPSVTAVRIVDADPVPLSLLWLKGTRNPHVAALARLARTIEATFAPAG